MTEQTKDAGKEQRVVLNLNMTQAKELRLVLEDPTLKTSEIAQKLLSRISKTINKHMTLSRTDEEAYADREEDRVAMEAENGNL
jgi:hypothetical protein